jgi:L-ribulose-5-phosphate 3-epimerase
VANPLAAHTNCFHGYDLDDALRGIADAGFRHVELTSVPGWDEQVRLNGSSDLRKSLEQYGLTPVSLSGHSELTTKEGLEHGVKAVRWSGEFGIPIVNTYVGGHGSEGEDEEAFLANIDALADAADEAGVTVAIEIHGELFGSGELGAAMLEKIGRDSIRINYDTANCEFYGGVKAVDDLPKVTSLVPHVHLKDTMGGKGAWNFPAIGDGSVDFPRVLEIMRDARYEGPYSVEIEFEGEPWPPLEQCREAVNRSYAYLRSLGLS